MGKKAKGVPSLVVLSPRTQGCSEEGRKEPRNEGPFLGAALFSPEEETGVKSVTSGSGAMLTDHHPGSQNLSGVSAPCLLLSPIRHVVV